MENLERALEAVLFAVGEPVPNARLTKLLGCSDSDLEQAANALRSQLSYERHGIRLLHLEDRWQLCTVPELSEYVTAALEVRKPTRLTASALETLAVIAYYQPTTRVYVEQLRGVDSSYSISNLLRRELIEECGRLEVPGRPILYRTTPNFLRVFGLESLGQLPPLDELANAGELQMAKEEPAHVDSGEYSGDSAAFGLDPSGTANPVQ